MAKLSSVASKFCGDLDKDKVTNINQNAYFYALLARFEPFINKEQTLVVQLTVKHEQNIDCESSCLNLFPDRLDQSDVHGDSKYDIIFGLDISSPCTKKVHFTFNRARMC